MVCLIYWEHYLFSFLSPASRRINSVKQNKKKQEDKNIWARYVA